MKNILTKFVQNMIFILNKFILKNFILNKKIKKILKKIT